MEFEISRSKRCVDLAGSVNGYLILQVVAYHQLSLLRSTAPANSYSDVRDAWEKSQPAQMMDLPYILNTPLSLNWQELTRRQRGELF